MHIENYNETENDLLLSQDNNLEFFSSQKDCCPSIFFKTHIIFCVRIIRSMSTIFSPPFSMSFITAFCFTLSFSCSFLNSTKIPKLTNSMKNHCKAELTVTECLNVLSSFNNDRTSGNDGLTVEFYKTFWDHIGKMLVDCLNYSYKHGALSTTQKQALITLLQKENRDRRMIKNWRPISLINVDVKIGLKAIAKRPEKALPSIIHFDQTSYVKGRTIFDALRTIEDVLDFNKAKNLSGLLITIDFQKAFDSVRWEFLIKALKAFNFGPSFISWIKTSTKMSLAV